MTVWCNAGPCFCERPSDLQVTLKQTLQGKKRKKRDGKKLRCTTCKVWVLISGRLQMLELELILYCWSSPNSSGYIKHCSFLSYVLRKRKKNITGPGTECVRARLWALPPSIHAPCSHGILSCPTTHNKGSVLRSPGRRLIACLG